MAGKILALVVGFVALAALMSWAIEAYFSSEGIELGVHGVVATFLCLVFIPATTIGLMRLLRISQDKGFDERADSYASDHGHRNDQP